jgi:hypothetical protein
MRHENNDFSVFSGRIVPAFQVLDREVLFRVFENRMSSDSKQS